MKYGIPPRRHFRGAFSLVELLVVLGIAAVLIGLLLPAIHKVQRQSLSVQCQSNLRQVGLSLQMYQNQNGGWFYPVIVTSGDVVIGRGTNLPPHDRWPVYVFDMSGAPSSPSYDPAAYSSSVSDPILFNPWPYTPEVLRCPTDSEPGEAHSYFLNSYPVDQFAKAGNLQKAGLSASHVILAGEKYGMKRDYYMQGDADVLIVVDTFHHGPTLASNYLYVDGHVQRASGQEAVPALNPWGSTPTQNP